LFKVIVRVFTWTASKINRKERNKELQEKIVYFRLLLV